MMSTNKILYILLIDNNSEKEIYIVKDVNNIKGTIIDYILVKRQGNVTLMEIQNDEVIIDEEKLDNLKYNENVKFISLSDVYKILIQSVQN